MDLRIRVSTNPPDRQMPVSAALEDNPFPNPCLSGSSVVLSPCEPLSSSASIGVICGYILRLFISWRSWHLGGSILSVSIQWSSGFQLFISFPEFQMPF
jgi:hypothetical protein